MHWAKGNSISRSWRGSLRRAAAAGLVTGWVDRRGRPYPAVFTAPTVQAGDLVGVVDLLLRLPER